MFVDDEGMLIELAEDILGRYGYRVSAFRNGADAFKAFRQDPDTYDLVITDMTMPHMDGAEMSTEILALRPDMPIILCTGHSETINREKALSLGICEYCEKPMPMSRLVRTIRSVLDQRKQQ